MNGYQDQAEAARKQTEQDALKRLRRRQEIADIRWLMSTPQGRRVVDRLLEMSGVMHISFDTNAMRMAFNEGKRNTGNEILQEVMDLCPDAYLLMLKERWNDRAGNGNQSK